VKKIVIILSLFFLVAATNCGAPQSGVGSGSGSGSSIGQIAASCATVDIGQTIPDIGMTIFQDVSTIVQAGNAGWEAALEDIGVKYGADVLKCALKAAWDKLTAHPAGTMAPPPSPAATRAKTFMVSHHYEYAQ
jgi:hypothetical protein